MTARPAAPGGIRSRLAWTARLVALDLRRHRRARILGACAFAVATLAVGAALASWRIRGEAQRLEASETGAELVAFVRDDVPTPARDALATALRQLDGVAGVRQLASAEALQRMRADLGDRAAVLDGVEEGFLPATLEISLRAGPAGVGRADAIAWRLRRMEGIADVDVLRSSSDERLTRAGLRGRWLGQLALGLAVATALLAVALAGRAQKGRRSEAQLLSGLGFTAAGVAAPAALAGAMCATAGTAAGLLLLAALTQVGQRVGAVAAPWWGGLTFTAPSGMGTGWAAVLGGLAAALLTGAALGWRGAGAPRREVEDLAYAD